MEKRIIVSAIIMKEDSVLLIRKGKGKPPYPDVWHLPGGSIYDQERGEELLLENQYNDIYFHKELSRKIIEETSVLITDVQNLCPTYRNSPREGFTTNLYGRMIHYVFLEYLCKYLDNTPQPGEDIQDVKWVPKSKLGKLDLTPPSIEMYGELGWL